MIWLTVKDLAEYLQMSVESVYKASQRGRIPAHKVLGMWRFSKEEIDKWAMKQPYKKIKKG